MNESSERYRLIEQIGEGRFAVVHKAEKLDVHKIVALKVLKNEFVSRAELREQFRLQAQLQASQTHHRIVQVEDLQSKHGQFFIALEYLQNGDLGTWLKIHGLPSFRQTAILVADIADALDFLHNKQLVHGDVKPSNILLYPDPSQKDILRAKLSDLRAATSNGVSLTVSENMLEGTAEYISPEEADGNAPDLYSDQYALGIVAYELLIGVPPFTSDNIATTYRKHKNESPQPPSQRNSRVTKEMDVVLLRALQKKSKERYASCSDFAKSFRSAAANTEQKRFEELIRLAKQALEKQELLQAYEAVSEALLIHPENEEALRILAYVKELELQNKNYQQAEEFLEIAEEKAMSIRANAPTHPDEVGLLDTFAPPSPSLAYRLYQRWQPGLRLAAVLLGLLTFLVFFSTTLIDTVGHTSVQPKIVAIDRTPTFTPTLTFTPSPTPTFTLTFTPTFTPTPTLPPTATATLYGGGSGQIGFRNGNDEIIVVGIDSKQAKFIGNSLKVGANFALSPDGKKIIFSIGGYYANTIYIMDIDSSEQKPLTDNTNSSNGYYDFSWSPDGKQILFVSRRRGESSIEVMNMDGSNKKLLTDNFGLASEPSWSPDGTKIVYVEGYGGIREIYVMNADGSGKTKLTRNFLSDYSPSWSPDGKKIAFIRGVDSNSEIYTMNSDGRRQTQLTKNSYQDFYPAWSPDGTKIAFMRDQNGSDKRAIYIMNASGTTQTRLVEGRLSFYYPAWSPDGKKIAFLNSINGTYAISIINTDGSNEEVIIEGVSWSSLPIWLP
jgi:Tol biopolymer transport system component/serine/threonine protein kinase